jgi:hypothetical protein
MKEQKVFTQIKNKKGEERTVDPDGTDEDWIGENLYGRKVIDTMDEVVLSLSGLVRRRSWDKEVRFWGKGIESQTGQLWLWRGQLCQGRITT